VTVAELIDELARFPPHHVVCVVHDDDSGWGEVTGSSSTEATIVELHSIYPGVVSIDCSGEE